MAVSGKKTARAQKNTRPSWDEYFLGIMEMVGARATCSRGRAGCVVVRDRQILSTGYVGAPAGARHCDEVGHELHTVQNADNTVTEHCVRTTHAEQNAIASAARRGIVLEGAILYCSMTPCYICAKMIINAGIKKVIAREEYQAAKRSKAVFKETGVSFKLLHARLRTYEHGS